MRHALIIINPVAGKGKGLVLKDKLLSMFNEKGITYDLVISEYVGEIEEISKKIDEDIYNELIVVGGDGSIVEALGGIIGKNIKLGIVPIGTGNDFIRSYDGKIDVKKAIDNILRGETNKSDIGLINGHYFINVSGFGMDSYILENLNKIKKIIKGSLAYTVSTFYTLISYKSKKISFEIDGVNYKREIMLAAICNGIYFGGGMMISPNTKVDDGLFELVIVNKMKKLKFIGVFLKVFKGTHIELKEVEVFSGKEFKIISEERIPLNVDGNIIGNTPVTANITEYQIEVFS
ncbi:MAG: diacylglycerol kinase family lipid kinase [Clostridiales bacterium]|nr:diacylglycerol kinase family lipid kinase [Clostridiales bacterium]